jgi:hypothetical protein
MKENDGEPINLELGREMNGARKRKCAKVLLGRVVACQSGKEWGNGIELGQDRFFRIPQELSDINYFIYDRT